MANQVTNVTLTKFGDSDREMYCSWEWSKENDHTENYKIQYVTYITVNSDVQNGKIITDATSDHTSFTFTADSRATSVSITITPISEQYESNDQTLYYWTAEASTAVSYSFSECPDKPDAPTLTQENGKLIVSVEYADSKGLAKYLDVQIVRKNSEKVVSTGFCQKSTLDDTWTYTTNDIRELNWYSADPIHARVRATVAIGWEYWKDVTSDWSEWSDEVGQKPVIAPVITECRAESESSIYLSWTYNTDKGSQNPQAASYDIQYTTDKSHFDIGDDVTTETEITTLSYIKTGLDSGDEYFFRVRAVNEYGEGEWSDIASTVIGTQPTAPTTWSSTTTAVAGESVMLYWVHNSEDNSTQRKAEIYYIAGGVAHTKTIDTSSEDDDNKTMYYVFDTSSLSTGTVITWKVRTYGIAQEPSEWSVQRTITIYGKPSLTLSVTDVSGNAVSIINSFPFYISGGTSPAAQTPLGYYVSIVAEDGYNISDETGTVKTVAAGSEVYGKYYDTSEQLLVEISAGDVFLKNNVTYRVYGVASMNSGLTAEGSSTIYIRWSDDSYDPNATVVIDAESLSAYIGPYCEDSSGNLVDNVTLSVYRREYDGSYTEIATGMKNSKSNFTTDPHPALDYARYRIVAISTDTGAVSYYDMPAVYVGEPSIVIQWDDDWKDFNLIDGLESQIERPYTGSLLKLKGNVDVSPSYSNDITLVEYIGRSNPVSYYGTQHGEAMSLNTDIAKSDTETLYALRRLAIWMGDVYVREPSGSGYWANISVSFNRTHMETTIPVTLSITRVEGGV